jgi:GNAT superfamily N-acetyltransferase
VSEVRLPEGFRFEPLRRGHPRKDFYCGRKEVDDWLTTKALQHQKKHLSSTKVLLGPSQEIAGYYTLATGQVDFGDLPVEMARKLPRRSLPVAVLAWLGVSEDFQGQGLGRLLLAQALRDCHAAGQTFACVAIILDCLDEEAKAFYQQWDFEEVPGYPYRLFLSTTRLNAMLKGK